MKKQYNILLILVLLFTACEKEIEFDKKLIQSKLVVNSFITADSIIDVKISASKTIPGVEQSFVWPDDATVKLYIDGVETETLSTYTIEYPETEEQIWYYSTESRPSVGYHSINTIAEAGKTYRLEVSHANYETAVSETFVPEKVEILSFTSEEITENRNEYEEKYQQFKIKFSDPAGVKNYYRIAIQNFSGMARPNFEDPKDTTSIIFLSNQSVDYVQSDDRLLNPDQEDANDFLFGSPSNAYTLFTDEFIDGKEYELQFEISKNSNFAAYHNGVEVEFSHKGEFNIYTISLMAITEEAYLYIRASYAQHWYGDDFFSEPVQAYSNIENGVGIFAGYNSSTIVSQEGEYPVDGVIYEDAYAY